MDFITSFIPITVVAAVIIFLVKEILELIRRRRADVRRIAGLKTMLAREIELNNWTIKALKMTLQAVEHGLEEQPPDQFFINFEKFGRAVFKVVRSNRGPASWPIPEVHGAIISRYMFDAASLDRELFRSLQSTYDAISELQHLRESLISYVMNEDTDFPDFLSGFVEYARKELSKIQSPLSSLYQICTGQELIEHRLR